MSKVHRLPHQAQKGQPAVGRPLPLSGSRNSQATAPGVAWLEPFAAIPRRWYTGVSAGVLGAAVLVWAVLTYGGFVSPLFLPSPTKVLTTGIQLFQEGVLVSHIAASVYRVGVGFLLAAVLAVPLGILMGSLKVVEALVEPIVNFVRYLPVTAMIPLLILYLGIADLQKIAVIFIGTFFQLVLLIADVTANVQRELLQAAYTLGASRRQVFFQVLVPATLPGVIDNLRITLGWAWTYLVVAELVAAESGLGYMILRAQRFLHTDRIFVGLFVIGLLGLISDYLFKALYRRLLPWSQKA